MFFYFLCHILSIEYSGLSYEFILSEYGFSIKSKIPFTSPGDKPILTLKITFTNFCRFRYFTDFDIKIVLSGQKGFE